MLFFFLIHCYVYQYRRLFPRKQENKSKFWHFPLFVQEPPGSTTIFLGTLDITFSNFLCYNEPDRRKCFCLFLFTCLFVNFARRPFVLPTFVCYISINFVCIVLKKSQEWKFTPVIFLTAFCYFLSLFASVPFSRADASRSSSTPV